jgi:RNA polymerase primary sigma factor
MQEIDRTQPLTPKDEYECALRAQAGDEEARNLLVQSNLRFVVSIAKMYTNNGVILQELIQAGNIGLLTAAQKYDPSRGFKFISYAVFHIRNEIIKELTNNSRMVRIPAHKVQLISKAKKGQSEIYTKMGREATDEELLDWLKERTPLAQALTLEELRYMMVSDLKTASMDRQFDSDDSGSATLGDTLMSEEEDPDEDFDRNYRKEALAEMMQDLSPLDQEILLDYFGFNEFQLPSSSVQISERLGFSVETIRNRIRKAIARMKISARKKGIDPGDLLGF